MCLTGTMLRKIFLVVKFLAYTVSTAFPPRLVPYFHVYFVHIPIPVLDPVIFFRMKINILVKNATTVAAPTAFWLTVCFNTLSYSI